MSDNGRLICYLVALACFVFAAFRNGIGRTKTDFIGLGLAFSILVAVVDSWDVVF